MVRHLICVQCPLGCQLTVEYDGEHEPVVTGNTCKNGAMYGKSEVTDSAPHADHLCKGGGGHGGPFRCEAHSPFPKRY